MREKVIAVTLSVGQSVCLFVHFTGFRIWLTLTFDESTDLSTGDDPLRSHEQNISFITASMLGGGDLMPPVSTILFRRFSAS